MGLKDTLNDLIKEQEKSNTEISEELGVSLSLMSRWINKSVDLKLESLIKLANYFNCSLEYLCGRTKTDFVYIPKRCPPFYDRLKFVMQKDNVTEYKLTHNTIITPAQFQQWRHGVEPRLSSLEVLADYLNVTLDYLVGRER